MLPKLYYSSSENRQLQILFLAHDTEKEDKDDLEPSGNIIDLRPGQAVSDYEELDEPSKVWVQKLENLFLKFLKFFS